MLPSVIAQGNKKTTSKSKIINNIEKALDEIGPFLKSDGGNIEWVEFNNDIVKVRLLGNCIDCSVNQMTLKNGVEMTRKKHVPSIKKVVNVEWLRLIL